MKDHHRMRAWLDGIAVYGSMTDHVWHTARPGSKGVDAMGTSFPFVTSVRDESDKLELCTGLRDKNGVLIYEGDILNCPSWWWGPGFVYLNRGVCGPCSGDSVMSYILAKDIKNPQKGASYNIWNGADVEVIGNIHQNPELLS